MRYIDIKPNYRIQHDELGRPEYFEESYKGYKAAPLKSRKYTYGDIRFRFNEYKTTDNWLYGN